MTFYAYITRRCSLVIAAAWCDLAGIVGPQTSTMENRRLVFLVVFITVLDVSVSTGILGYLLDKTLFSAIPTTMNHDVILIPYPELHLF